ncbi:LysE family translocator [Lysobacter sp. HA18]
MGPSAQTLLLFVAACSGLLVSPGPNMALVVSQGLAYGPRGGVAVAAGIMIADLVLTTLVVAGVAAMLAAWPPSLDMLRFAGVAYLVWLALKSLRRRRESDLPISEPRSTRAIVQLSVLTSLLNPKALLFFMVFLPQFVEPQRGGVAMQLALLGAVLATIAFVFHALLGVASARARGWAEGQGNRVKWVDRLQAVVFLGIALRLLLLETTSH